MTGVTKTREIVECGRSIPTDYHQPPIPTWTGLLLESRPQAWSSDVAGFVVVTVVRSFCASLTLEIETLMDCESILYRVENVLFAEIIWTCGPLCLKLLFLSWHSIWHDLPFNTLAIVLKLTFWSSNWLQIDIWPSNWHCANLTFKLTFDIWPSFLLDFKLTFRFKLTSNWHLTSDLQISLRHLTFDLQIHIWHLTFDFKLTFDIWHLTFKLTSNWHLTFKLTFDLQIDIWPSNWLQIDISLQISIWHLTFKLTSNWH